MHESLHGVCRENEMKDPANERRSRETKKKGEGARERESKKERPNKARLFFFHCCASRALQELRTMSAFRRTYYRLLARNY